MKTRRTRPQAFFKWLDCVRFGVVVVGGVLATICVTDMVWWTKAHGPCILKSAKREKFKVMNCNHCDGFWQTVAHRRCVKLKPFTDND